MLEGGSSVETDLEIQTDALGQYEALKREKEEMILLKQSNSQPALSQYRKAHENNKSFLKSDLKKTTAFVKKIRSINFEGLQQCIRDTETLNLTLYISEIVVAITETKYKATDVPSMVKLCISLHRRYEDFTAALLTNIKSVIFSPTSDDDKEFGKKKRILIRFVIELYQAGVWNDESFFVDLLRSLLGKSKG
jgi:regulator of nonsense transcripts 2